MAYTLTDRAPGASDLTAKNRVWGFFANPSRTRPENRRQALQPRRKNRPTATKTASGIPLWLSRDPIEETGGINIYAFVENDGVDLWDFLGQKTCTKSRYTKKFNLKLPSFLSDLKIQGEAGFRIVYEECDDGTTTWEGDAYGSLKVKGPVRVYGIPLAKGNNGLFAIGSLEAHGKGKATWCNDKLKSGYFQGEIRLWLGLSLDLWRVSGTGEVGGAFKFSAGMVDEALALHLSLEVAARARIVANAGWGLSYERIWQESATSPPFKILHVSRTESTVLGISQ